MRFGLSETKGFSVEWQMTVGNQLFLYVWKAIKVEGSLEEFQFQFQFQSFQI